MYKRQPYNDPYAKGIYHGLTLSHTKAELIRSTMEGIIFGLKNSLEIFQDMGVEFQRILASGGGARGRLFRQIQADMFGKEIYTSLIQEQACMGAAITAAVGTGGYASVSYTHLYWAIPQGYPRSGSYSQSYWAEACLVSSA